VHYYGHEQISVKLIYVKSDLGVSPCTSSLRTKDYNNSKHN